MSAADHPVFANMPNTQARLRALQPTCPECGRVFDLLDENDADEWANGHDCEPADPTVCVDADDECFGEVVRGRCFRHTDQDSGYGQRTQREIDEAGRYQL